MEKIEALAATSTTRRTVIKAAAWTTPILAASMSAPGAVASVNPPVASYSQVATDNVPHNQWGLIQVKGRANDGGFTVDGALPADAFFTVTPPAGATLSISPLNQFGVQSITGPDANGAYTVYPVFGTTEVRIFTQLSQPGNLSAQVFGSAPGGPSFGVRS